MEKNREWFRRAFRPIQPTSNQPPHLASLLVPLGFATLCSNSTLSTRVGNDCWLVRGHTYYVFAVAWLVDF